MTNILNVHDLLENTRSVLIKSLRAYKNQLIKDEREWLISKSIGTVDDEKVAYKIDLIAGEMAVVQALLKEANL